MKKMMFLAVAAAAVALSQPPQASAQVSEALSLTAQAVKELTDFPAVGKRYTVDLTKLGGADVRQIDKAAGLYQDALAKAKGASADKNAIHQLEMATAYAKARLHKEARLSGQGALFYLCKQNNGEPKETCEKVPKYGSYTAP
ncbi:MAG: helix-hairpin-helix domain-containing protein [Nitrospirota bacterium]